MSDVKLKRSDLHPLKTWSWNCPICDWWNETQCDPDCVLTEEYECGGCFHEFEWDSEAKDGND